MKEAKAFTIVNICCVILIIIIVLVKGDLNEHWEKEAIDRGYGAYEEGEFRWKAPHLKEFYKD